VFFFIVKGLQYKNGNYIPQDKTLQRLSCFQPKQSDEIQPSTSAESKLSTSENGSQ
jgi:hypothetical protein